MRKKAREHLKRIDAPAGMGSNAWMRIDAWTRNTAVPGAPRTAEEIIAAAPDTALAELGPRQQDSGRQGLFAIKHKWSFLWDFMKNCGIVKKG